MPEFSEGNAVVSTDDEECPDTLRRPPSSMMAAREELDGVLDALGLDEVAVLVRIAERLKHGVHAYGPLQLGQDVRAFREVEAREEIEDALVYLACAWLKSEVRSEAQEVTP